MNHKYHHSLKLSVVLAFALAALSANAFDISTYTSTSAFADGKWVKISVPESGVYKITKSQLTNWGFSDPSKVRVYGYGGERIADRLTLDNYADDISMIQSEMVSDGIVFYGVGPNSWVESSGRYKLQQNIYSNVGYYFLSDKDAADVPEIPIDGSDNVSNPTTTFVDRRHYELDQTSPGEAGYLLVGESFKTQNDRRISFNTPDLVASEKAWLECAVVAKTYTNSTIEITVNGQKLQSQVSDRISAISTNHYLHGSYNVTAHTVDLSGSKVDIKLAVANISSVQSAWLDYVALNYTRALNLGSNASMCFWSDMPSLKLTAASANDVTVWDVTNPLAITAMNTAKESDGVKWLNYFSGKRSYVAWSKSKTLPSPSYVGSVSNQNIHGMDTPEMVIFTLPEFKAQAQRIADMHAAAVRPLNVAVINVEEVYNEFASGAPDVSALRKCLKMFYDRSLGSDKPIRYAMLVGRATYDNRHLTSQFSGSVAHNTIPCWMGEAASMQLSDNTGYGTDDFIAMLEDNSGLSLGIDNLCVSVGRLPVTSVSEIKNYIDKLQQYTQESIAGTWKNSLLFLADDGDNGIHLDQTENMLKELKNTPGQQTFVTKVYVDAYELAAGVSEGARADLYRMLNEGVSWWNFTGHANNHSWTSEGVLTYTDINSLYLKKIPILFAATCDFLRWDSNILSGGEILFHERNGGTIAMISATRPVYISNNGYFTKAMGRAMMQRDANGDIQRLGDIYRIAKNDIRNDKGEHTSDLNRLRFVLMGDPAMSLPFPNNTVRIEAVDGVELTPDNQVTLMALQQSEITGSVVNPSGEVITDFEGTIHLNIYDAECDVTTLGVREGNVQKTFQQHGDKLFSGIGKVSGGKFTMKVAMPGEVTDNFRPAMMNAYAFSDNKAIEAAGTTTDFYVYGYDESVAPDNEPPVIEQIMLNHESFTNGSSVNDSPMLIARVSDNVAINLSNAGIGHQMVITLDGRETFTDVSQFFTPADDGSPAGEIRYPMSGLTTGNHSLSLKVWDTAANSASKELSFMVDPTSTPTIFDVYTDVNPASTEVKFYIKHNRPDAELTATVTVYDLLGHPLWTTSANGLSDMFVTAPISWDLTDASGRRLPRGIYLYRATVSDNSGATYDSSTRRLAITAE